MIPLPGPALKDAPWAMAQVRDLLMKLFAMDEAEAVARIIHDLPEPRLFF